jgi:hypothetical protein
MVRVTRGTIVVAFVTLLVLAGAAPAEEKEKTRNPFGQRRERLFWVAERG